MAKKRHIWLKSNIISLSYICMGIIFSTTMGIMAKENNSVESDQILYTTNMTTTIMNTEESTTIVTNTPEFNDNFFKDSVFIGDSVMYGFEKFVTRKGNGFIGDPKFLTVGNYAVRLNLEPVTEQSTHPMYKGIKCTMEQAVSMMEVKKVFLFFGLNDIAITGINKTIENYYICIQKIREQTPDVEIYILSTTYIAIGSEKTVLNNENIRLFNEQLESNSIAWGVEYIDLASYLLDEQGYLANQYCSDGYVHLNESAYNIWVSVLRNFASTK